MALVLGSLQGRHVGIVDVREVGGIKTKRFLQWRVVHNTMFHEKRQVSGICVINPEIGSQK
jgi:hypothetical protein